MRAMKTRTRLAALALLAAAAGTLALSGCHPTTHATTSADLGVARATSELEAVVDEPGPITVETVVGADWEVPRSGVLNLDHPKAKAAGLKDEPEPIVVVFHAIRHPRAGLFLVDTGAEKALRDDPAASAIGDGFFASASGANKMKIRTDTAGWIAAQPDRVQGVFLTHLHLDHVSGMRDVPRDAAIFMGPGEASETGFLNVFVQGVTDTALSGKGPLRQWPFRPDRDGAFAGVLDVFGDGTFWALHVPGHTAGSTAYLARTKDGPVLLTGDASHTTWGWDNGVEPGSFSSDRPRSAESLARLRNFVAKHPHIEVRVGHQLRAKPPAPSPRANDAAR
jgi:N-acyl homoserine lactone hydrolase